jgi:hypothetical protein
VELELDRPAKLQDDFVIDLGKFGAELGDLAAAVGHCEIEAWTTARHDRLPRGCADDEAPPGSLRKS